MRLFATLFLGVHLVFGQYGGLPAEEKPSADARELVVTVLGKPIYLDQITSAEAPAKRKELSEPEYRRWLRSQRAFQLVSRISGQVLQEYVIREKLSPSDEEIDALLAEASKKALLNIPADKEAQRKLAIQAFWVQGASRDWRTAKALYEKYGGRVAVSSFGACTSFEGRNAVLKDYADRGDIKFSHAHLERAFWEQTKDKRILDVTLQPDSVADHFKVAPWERWLADLEKKAAEANDEKKDEAKP